MWLTVRPRVTSLRTAHLSRGIVHVPWLRICPSFFAVLQTSVLLLLVAFWSQIFHGLRKQFPLNPRKYFRWSVCSCGGKSQVYKLGNPDKPSFERKVCVCSRDCHILRGGIFTFGDKQESQEGGELSPVPEISPCCAWAKSLPLHPCRRPTLPAHGA